MNKQVIEKSIERIEKGDYENIDLSIVLDSSMSIEKKNNVHLVEQIKKFYNKGGTTLFSNFNKYLKSNHITFKISEIFDILIFLYQKGDELSASFFINILNLEKQIIYNDQTIPLKFADLAFMYNFFKNYSEKIDNDKVRDFLLKVLTDIYYDLTSLSVAEHKRFPIFLETGVNEREHIEYIKQMYQKFKKYCDSKNNS